MKIFWNLLFQIYFVISNSETHYNDFFQICYYKLKLVRTDSTIPYNKFNSL